MPRIGLASVATALVLAGCTPPPQGLGLFSSGRDRTRRSIYRVEWRVQVQPDTVEDPPVNLQLERWAPLESSGPLLLASAREVVVGSTSGRVSAYSLLGKPLWHFQTEGPIAESPTVSGVNLYAASADGRVYALDPTTGRERWRFDLGEEPASSPISSADKLFIATHQGSLFALDAATGKRLWHYRREERQEFTLRRVAAPRADGPFVIAGFADGTTVALKIENGELAWEHSSKAGEQLVDADATQLGNGRVFVATFRDGILALDRATGEEVWRKPFPAATGLLFRDGILFASAVGKLSAMSPIDGSVLWEKGLGDRTPGTLSIDGSLLVVPTSTDLLFLDDRSGREIGAAFNPGRGIEAPPAASGRELYVLSNAGWLYALRLL